MDAAAPPTAVIESHEQDGRAAASVEPQAAPQAHAVDLGLAYFLRAGIASSGVVGLSPFVTDELGRDVFLRIAASVGQAPASGLHLTWVAGRLDTCAETTGNYARGSGLRLDLCGGADVGGTFIAPVGPTPAQSQPFIDIGPSVDLRAEMGPSAAFLLRASAGLSIARDAFVDATGATFQPPLATVDIEVALSWTLPGSQPRYPLNAASASSRTR
jgi:hypothetical protein